MGYVYVGNAVIYTYPCQIFSQLYHTTIVHLPHFAPIIQKSFTQYILLLQYQENYFFLACSKLHLVLPTTVLGLSGVFSQKIDNSTVHKSKKAACDGDLYYGLPVDTVTHLFGGERRTSINLRPLAI